MATRLVAVIILKCIEISNHYAAHQELLQCCGSITLQNKQCTKPQRKRAQICGYGRQRVEEEESDEGGRKLQSFSYKININMH